MRKKRKIQRAFLLKCGKCFHEFRRMFPVDSLNKKTRCPKCHESISRNDSLVPALDLFSDTSVKNNNPNRRILANKFIGSNAIKCDQIPVSRHEAVFKRKCFDKKWQPHRPSWPDFLVEDGNGNYFAVEVKGKGDCISKTQRQTFDLMTKMGIPVYIWYNSPSASHRMFRWKEGLSLPKIDQIAMSQKQMINF